jgi:hypothetical protein
MAYLKPRHSGRAGISFLQQPNVNPPTAAALKILPDVLTKSAGISFLQQPNVNPPTAAALKILPDVLTKSLRLQLAIIFFFRLIIPLNQDSKYTILRPRKSLIARCHFQFVICNLQFATLQDYTTISS